MTGVPKNPISKNENSNILLDAPFVLLCTIFCVCPLASTQESSPTYLLHVYKVIERYSGKPTMIIVAFYNSKRSI